MEAGKRMVVELEGASNHRFDFECLFEESARSSSERCTQGAVAQQGLQRIVQGVFIRAPNQEPVPALMHRFGDAAGICCNDGKAGAH